MENENIQTQEEGLSLMDIFHILRVHLIALIIFIVAGFAIGVGTAFILKPSYEATQRVYLLNNIGGDSSDPSNQIVESLRIIDTFKDFITDPAVAKETISLIDDKNLLPGTELDYLEIIENIDTSTSTDTTVCIVISYTSGAENISRIVLENLIIAAQDISSSDSRFTMFKDMITIASQGPNYGDGTTCECEEVSASKTLFGLIGIVGGLVIGVIYAFVREALDNTVSSPKYIEDKYKLKVIGIIPDLLDEKEDIGGEKHAK